MKDSLLIIDEAHNIGGVCEEVASLDLTTYKLGKTIEELKSLKSTISNQSKHGEKSSCKLIEFNRKVNF